MIPKIILEDLEFSLIQGGMGVGISRSGLASAVANEGGAGIIAAVGLSALGNYSGSYVERNEQALREEIRLAREKTKGVVGVNVMCALYDDESLMKVALKENVDLIISGAGLPLELPTYKKNIGNKKTKLIPIVSSARAAKIILHQWAFKRDYVPDAILIEGPKAGGHLGYSLEELNDESFVDKGLEKILKGVLEIVEGYEKKGGRKIPVIVAGGIYYGGDIKRFYELGAAGVQMATRFVTTVECDAPLEFKQKYLDSKKEDIVLLESPVGYPGRAINSQFLEDVKLGKKIAFSCPYYCLRDCGRNEAKYCIADALVNAVKGNLTEGFVFCSTNAWRTKEDGIISVRELFKKINREYEENKSSRQ
jgi:NAD(P)H-dependent flavin oxidoreductase YrpB (nitropropane dioxygenase family)